MKSLSKRALFMSANAILLGSSLGLSNAHAAGATQFQPDKTGVACKKTTACFAGANSGSGAGIAGISSGSSPLRYDLGAVEGGASGAGNGVYAYADNSDQATRLASPSVEPQRIVNYTFGTASSAPYCNGVSLTQTGYLAVGYGLYTNCGSYNVNAGGFASKIKGLDNHTVWAITTTDPEAPGNTYVYLLDERARQWEVWGESNTGSFTFSFVNSGVLLLGYTNARRGSVSATQGRR